MRLLPLYDGWDRKFSTPDEEHGLAVFTNKISLISSTNPRDSP
jgi:hypothetical protein